MLPKGKPKEKKMIKKGNKWYEQEETEVDKAALEERLQALMDRKAEKIARVTAEYDGLIAKAQGWLDEMNE